jgi:hypothetical protein
MKANLIDGGSNRRMVRPIDPSHGNLGHGKAIPMGL